MIQQQEFIQEVLVMSIFEQRSSFQMFYFMVNTHKITIKYKWGSEGAVSSAVGSGGTLVSVQGVKALKNFGLFRPGGQIGSLKSDPHLLIFFYLRQW